MAKMFYSLEEAAQKLGKSPDQVKQMADSGELSFFKDRDKVLFKREQVDLLAGGTGSGKGDSGYIPLADSGAGSGMGLSLEDSAAGSKGGSGTIELDEPKDRDKSGISIFDTENTEEGDPSAVTRITETRAGGDTELTLESVGSGSGLLDLTREADDTSLGADLLEDVYKPESEGGNEGGGGGGALFESTTAPSDVGAAAGMAPMGMMALEPYDGAGSGWTGGLALGALLACTLGVGITLMGIMGAEDSFSQTIGQKMIMIIGGLAVLTLIFAAVGFLLGKRTG